jgi:hypothetical protein
MSKVKRKIDLLLPVTNFMFGAVLTLELQIFPLPVALISLVDLGICKTSQQISYGDTLLSSI